MPDSFSHKTHKRRNFHNFLFTGPSCACTWSTAASSVLRGPSRSYLHRDFESIQGGSAGPRNCSCSSTCDQMSPPHPSLLFLNGEVIGDHEILSNIEYLIRRWQEWSDIESKKPLVEVLVILSRQLTEITLIMETYMKRLQRTEWRLVSHGPLLNILEQDPFCVKLLFLTNMW